MHERLNELPLRRTLFRGYRVADVQVLAAHWRAAIDRLEAEAARAQERSGELETELLAMRTRLESYIAREVEVNKAMANANAKAQEIEERAQWNARRIQQEAEERAALVQAEVVAHVAATGQQIDDLLQAREQLLGNLRTAVAEFEVVLARIDRGAKTTTPQERLAGSGEPALLESPARIEQPAAPVEAHGADRVFEGRVELDAGSFLDFATLSTFERSLARIPNVSDVYVRRFADDRATIEVTFGAPIALVPAMKANLPYAFEVDSVGDAHLSLTVHVPSAAQVR